MGGVFASEFSIYRVAVRYETRKRVRYATRYVRFANVFYRGAVRILSKAWFFTPHSVGAICDRPPSSGANPTSWRPQVAPTGLSEHRRLTRCIDALVKRARHLIRRLSLATDEVLKRDFLPCFCRICANKVLRVDPTARRSPCGACALGFDCAIAARFLRSR